jgi:hypothetical protein
MARAVQEDVAFMVDVDAEGRRPGDVGYDAVGVAARDGDLSDQASLWARTLTAASAAGTRRERDEDTATTMMPQGGPHAPGAGTSEAAAPAAAAVEGEAETEAVDPWASVGGEPITAGQVEELARANELASEDMDAWVLPFVRAAAAAAAAAAGASSGGGEGDATTRCVCFSLEPRDMLLTYPAMADAEDAGAAAAFAVRYARADLPRAGEPAAAARAAFAAWLLGTAVRPLVDGSADPQAHGAAVLSLPGMAAFEPEAPLQVFVAFLAPRAAPHAVAQVAAAVAASPACVTTAPRLADLL